MPRKKTDKENFDPALERLLKDSTSDEVSLEDRDYKSTMAELEANEKREIIKMRTYWSYFLMLCVFVIIFCQMALFYLVGKGELAFKDPWLARLLFPGIFGEILGFVYVVINFLFPNSKK